MKLSNRNIFALYYNWIHSALPNDICTFFWGTLSIIILSPIVVPGRLLGYLDYRPDFWDNMKNGFIIWAAYILLIAFGIKMLGYEKGDAALSYITLFLWAPLLSLGVVISVISLIIAIVWLGNWIYTKIKSKNESFDESDVPTTPSKSSIWIGAIRKKHCTKIEWHDKS